MAVPVFPPPYVIERARSLGFGTGPWAREALVERWGAPMADKFIGEAKAAGWLVSPSRGTYFVPPARDLMVVSWLPEPARTEFLIARSLAGAELPGWCLSAWCRRQGLELGQPVFVTDLGVGAAARKASERGVQDRKALRAAAAEAAGRLRGSMPFEASLLIVPALPELRPGPSAELALVPEDAGAERARVLGRGLAFLLDLGVAAAVPNARPSGPAAWKEFGRLDRARRGIPYSAGADVDDEAWILALLAALGTPRLEELLGRLQGVSNVPAADIQRWAGLMGPPQPVAGWREALLEGGFPYLLVGPSLWAEMGADQAARRFRMLQRLGGR